MRDIGDALCESSQTELTPATSDCIGSFRLPLQKRTLVKRVVPPRSIGEWADSRLRSKATPPRWVLLRSRLMSISSNAPGNVAGILSSKPASLCIGSHLVPFRPRTERWSGAVELAILGQPFLPKERFGTGIFRKYLPRHNDTRWHAEHNLFW